MKTINLTDLDGFIKGASRFEQARNVYREVRLSYEKRKDEIVIPESFLKAPTPTKKLVLITLICELGHSWATFIKREDFGVPEEILFYYYIDYFLPLANFLGLDYETVDENELKDIEPNEELIRGFSEIMSDIAKFNITRNEELLLLLTKITEQIKVPITIIYKGIERVIDGLIECKLEGKPIEIWNTLKDMFLDGFSIDIYSLLMYKVIFERYDDLILKPYFASKNPKS